MMLRFCLGDERLTYREVDERSNALAHALIAQGLEPHDRIGLLLNNSQNSDPRRRPL